MASNNLRPVSSLFLLLALGACGGGGGGGASAPAPPAPPPTFAIGGTVSGLAGTGLVLRNNAGTDIAVSANGAFTFPALAQGSAYAVTVPTQPTQPWQTCTVTNGTGTANAAVTNVAVNCTTNNYKVGGTVTGLAGVKLVLQLAGGTMLPISQSGAFSFPDNVASGTTYSVTVATQPVGPGQDCFMGANGGTVAGGDVTTIEVSCITKNFASTVLDLDAQDMIYNPAAGELYVSVATTATTGPAIVVIDPRTAEILRTVATPQIAMPLAISDDSQFLYAGMGETGGIRRFSLPALTTSLDFSIGLDNTGHALVPADIRVAPGAPGTVAVSRTYTQAIPNNFGLAVYDDGVARANTVGGAMPQSGRRTDGAMWGANGTKLYSFDTSTSNCVVEALVTSSGVTAPNDCVPHIFERTFGTGVSGTPYAYRNFQMVGGRIYSGTGGIYDPSTRASVGTFRDSGLQGVAVDADYDRAYAAYGLGSVLTFRSFSLSRMTPDFIEHINAPLGAVQKLLRWGPFGLAALTDADHLVLVTGRFVAESGISGIPPRVTNLVTATATMGAYQARVYELPAYDVKWDEARQRLYASVSGTDEFFGNSIASIDVTANRVLSMAPVGSEPRWISQSDDGTKLYVTNYASSSIARVDAATMTLETVFLTNYPDHAPGYPLAAEPQPGNASSFAFIEHYPATGAIWTTMIAGTTLKPLRFDEPINTMAFFNANTLFGNNTSGSLLDLHEIGVVATGLQGVRNDQSIFNALTRMTSAGGLLYSDGGFSIDPVTRGIVQTYNPGISANFQVFRANPARDRGYMIFQDAGSNKQLAVFRLSDAALLVTVPIPYGSNPPVSLTSMGAKGVAFGTFGALFVVEGPDL
jgi:hypothetical protein